MKTFLTVLGALSLIGALFLLTVPEYGPFLAGTAIAEGALFLALAKLLAIQTSRMVEEQKHRTLEVEFWKLAVVKLEALQPPAGTPEPADSYRVATDGKDTGQAYTRAQILDLIERAALPDGAYLLRTGEAAWLPLTEARQRWLQA